MGAGLPAMQATRCVSHTEVMLSHASQLPYKPAFTFAFTVSAAQSAGCSALWAARAWQSRSSCSRTAFSGCRC
ncbi:hypothetical protein D7M10_26025 [Pseudomonas fluorescens]|nr:hypothetical protein D7M10_26025 [Pseudomonas fluorescens]